MSKTHSDQILSHEEKTPRVALFTAFFLSGMSGLIYQTVWVRMLTRYLGSTTAATAIVLCVFMGGLALGAWLGGRLADRIQRKLFSYALLEFGVAAIAILMSFLIIAVLGGLYVNFYPWFGESQVWLLLARIVFCLLCLLLPTALMGATLPFLVAFTSRSQYGFQSGLGRLYAVNTFGAVLGVGITGFVLIGELGESASLYAAATLNLLAGLVACWLERRSLSQRAVSNRVPGQSRESKVEMPAPYRTPVRIWSAVAIFISGFSALAYEILWTRFLMLPLQTSIYAFSIMLGFFLLGIALGSWLSTRFKISETRPLAVFAFFEILIGFLTVAGMLIFLKFGQGTEGYMGPYYLNFLTSFLIVFPVALVFGWQFPVAVRCCLRQQSRPGEDTGWAYAANTTGAILGSVIAGFVMIPLIGTAASFIVLAVLNAAIGIVLLILAPEDERGRLPVVSGVIVTVFILVIIGTGDPYRKVMQERVFKYMGPDAQVYGFYEGVAGNTVPAGSPRDPLLRNLFINGVGMTVLCTETKLMAHLPMSMVENPKRVLVICFGMGTTVRSASKYPAPDGAIDITAVDIVPRVFDCFKYFHQDAHQVVAKPNVHLYADDGRNFLLVHRGLYDAITIDPAPPLHSAGTVNLYTKEFFEICKAKIHQNGIVSMWLPQAPFTESLLIMKTFVTVFPGASLWGGLGHSGFYLIGGHRSFDQNDKSLSALAEKLSRIEDMGEWDHIYRDPEYLKLLYIMGSKELDAMVKGVPVITDDHPYTEFPIWRGVLSDKVPILDSDKVRIMLLRKRALEKK